MNLKQTDAHFLARHCQKKAHWEALAATNPPPTVKITSPAGERISVKNPTWDRLLALDRELRAEEALLGLTPMARVNLAQKIMAVGDKPPLAPSHSEFLPPTDGPLGVLKPKPN